jgi:dUTP pyrophosphatase
MFDSPPLAAVNFKKLHPDARLPERATPGSAGMDLHSVSGFDIEPGRVQLIPCGFAMEMARQFEAQIRPRSGLAMKHMVTLINSPATIDSDFRGELKVALVNFGTRTFTVTPGMRIAQMIIQELPDVIIKEVDELSDSSRGEGGFGSTGA